MNLEKLEALLKWGRENGAVYPKEVKFVDVPGKGLTCIAQEDIARATFQIPGNLIIKKSLAEKFFGIGENQNSWLKLLVAKLKFDKHATVVDDEDLGIKFAAFIEALPAQVDSPYIWNPSELELLGNTNLRKSLNSRLKLIFEEWRSLIGYLDEFATVAVAEAVTIQALLDSGSEEDIYRTITFKAFDADEDIPWWSFAAFLWSHLIFLSRAFPEYVIDRTADPTNVVLLPIVDLLNHDYNSKVEWNEKNGAFGICKLDSVSCGDEIFNNYGGKGNEELLSGYGFVLENNIFDTAALKINLPPDLLSKLAEETNIKLPEVSDYTTSAFDFDANAQTKPDACNKDKKFEDGLLYLLSKENNLSLTWLLDLFTYLNLTSSESLSNLRPRLQGLQNLRMAIEQKLQNLQQDQEGGVQRYSVQQYRAFCAQIYKAGQKSILKHAINELKRLEKSWTMTHKADLLTVKKLMKADPDFLEQQLPMVLGIDKNSELSLDSYNNLFFLWILCKNTLGGCPEGLEWVMTSYKEYVKEQNESAPAISNEIQALHQAIFANTPTKITQWQLAVAMNFVPTISYTRLSKDEVILVNTIDL